MNPAEQVMEMRKQRLCELMNELFSTTRIPHDNLNRVFCFSDREVLEKLVDMEKRYPELVLHVRRENSPVEGLTVRDGRGAVCIDGLSVASLLATITDVLCGEQLRFESADDGKITGVRWYNYQE